MGFGSVVVPVPAGRNFYQTQVLLPASAAIGGEPLLVDIVGGIDLNTGVIRWTFTALDPETGDLPENALAGFLPPNDAQGVGQGFADFAIRPRANLPTGTRIDAQATIIFDTNAPLDTPAIFDTIDAGPPTSQVQPLPARTGLNFPVSWTGTDDPQGAGVQAYDIFVSDNGGPFQIWLPGTTALTANYPGVAGHEYAFYSVAHDLVGHRELPPGGADATTRAVSLPWRNPNHEMDVSGDGNSNVPDMVLVLRRIGSNGAQQLPPPTLAFQPPPFFDVSGDNALTPFDLTLLLRFLRGPGGGPEPEPTPAADAGQSTAVDFAFAARQPWWNWLERDEPLEAQRREQPESAPAPRFPWRPPTARLSPVRHEQSPATATTEAEELWSEEVDWRLSEAGDPT